MGCGNPTIKRTIGVVEAFALLTAAVVAKGGDFFYKKETTGSWSGGCSYLNSDGQMRCIVGEGFLLKYGIENIDCRGSIITGKVQHYLYTKHDIVMTREASLILQAAQRTQDIGKSWGDALAAAVDQHYGIRKVVDPKDHDEYNPATYVEI